MALVTFTSNDTFVVPAGVTSIDIEMWAGGGSGAAAWGSGGRASGGGGGAYSKSAGVTVTPGDTLTITVGQGGTSVQGTGTVGDNSDGVAGGDSSVVDGDTNTLVLAKGGSRGDGATDAVASAGTGGQASAGTGDTKFSGGNGASSSNVGSTGGGGGAGDAGNGGSSSSNSSNTATSGGTGGTSGGGAGGNGAYAAGTGAVATAQAGNTLGGGGGGATAVGTNTTAISGAGFRGEVRLSYVSPPAVDTLADVDLPEATTNTPDALGVLTNVADEIEFKSAQANGAVTNSVSEDIIKRGFAYGITSGFHTLTGDFTHLATKRLFGEVTDAHSEDITKRGFIFGKISRVDDEGDYTFFDFKRVFGEVTASDEQVTRRGFVFGTTSLPDPGTTAHDMTDYDDFVTETGTFANEVFSMLLEGLSENTEYFFRAYAESSVAIQYGEELSFKVMGSYAGLVEESGTFGEEIFNLVTGGTLDDDSEYFYRVFAESAKGIGFGDELSFKTAGIYGNVEDEDGTFTEEEFALTLSALDEGTRYYFRAFAETAKGLGWGAERFFSTLELPETETKTPTEIEREEAQANGRVNYAPVPITRRGFVFDTETHTDPGNTDPDVSDYPNVEDETGTFGVGNFSLLIESLTPGETYFIRAFSRATQDGNNAFSYGEEIEFTTALEVPEMQTLSPTNITADSIDARGRIVSTFENADERGFVYGETTQSPGNVAPGSSGYDNFVDESGSFTAGEFLLEIASLDRTKDYFIRAFAHNSDGYGYGNEIKFKIGDWIPQGKPITSWTKQPI